MSERWMKDREYKILGIPVLTRYIVWWRPESNDDTYNDTHSAILPRDAQWRIFRFIKIFEYRD